MKEQILSIVLSCCEQYNEVSDRKVDISLGEAATLYGTQGVLDSLALVSLIVAVEQAIEDEMGVIVTLADNRAASQENSPFRTVATLVKYAQSCIEEEKGTHV